jgi:microcystin degradation protein MlrC
MAALHAATARHHTSPPLDMDAAAKRTLALLIAKAEGRTKPKIAVAKVPSIMPSFNMRTADGPMAELQQLAGLWRRQRGMLDVTIYGGFAYGDSPFAGPSVVAVAEKDQKLAQRCANALAAEFLKRKQQFYIRLPRPADGLLQAMKTEGDGPAIVLDPADNPLSGGIGDTPALFQALLDSKPPAGSLFAFFWDPPLVEECHRLGTGADIEARLGGRITADFGAPVTVAARILKLTDGKFRNEGPYEHKLAMDVGRTALLEAGQIRVIVTESCQAPNDPAYFRLHGIDPRTVPLLCVKAKNHFRAAFADMARCLVDVDAPGPASAGLFHYKFHHAPQHIW